MPRAKSTGGSPIKKSGGRTPARHTTPRKKSKTPSRKSAKSPAPKRARSRSVSKPHPASKKTLVHKSPSKSPPKSPSKSPPKSSLKSRKSQSPQNRTFRGRPRSRSRSTTKSTSTPKRQTPSLSQKLHQTAKVIEHKISTPIASLASNLRSRRAAHDTALSRLSHGAITSYGSRRSIPAQSIWRRVCNSQIGNSVRSMSRCLRWANVKRHFKRNWRRYVLAVVVAGSAYYSYQNKKAIEKALNEQYQKMVLLMEQQKTFQFSRYFSGWFEDFSTSSTTVLPPTTTPPRTAGQH